MWLVVVEVEMMTVIDFASTILALITVPQPLSLFCSAPFTLPIDRSGQGVDHTQNAEERSPVFLQFLDSIFQLLTQFPTSFEFSESLLVFLGDHVHSGSGSAL